MGQGQTKSASQEARPGVAADTLCQKCRMWSAVRRGVLGKDAAAFRKRGSFGCAFRRSAPLIVSRGKGMKAYPAPCKKNRAVFARPLSSESPYAVTSPHADD